jgi:hypothetical protein
MNEEDNNCPKPDCGRPEQTHRFKSGRRLSICGSGHSWDGIEVAAQRRKARDAQEQECKVDFGRIELPSYEEVIRQCEKMRRFPNI